MKELSDEQLELIGREMSKALISWAEVWKQGMKGISLSDQKYKDICSAGKKIQKAYQSMQDLAFDRGWPESKVKGVFNVSTAYGFS